ncbi:competence/damage-inducible protein A [Echinicola vietnamensis]|uniref:CinA-like protein n=1 Tax=Echinicola vietnamensis (strain DSM 17526 / LMG 23754 / KMM 6221) TaxID=926556 RepID=L0FXQ4_ECHVK|nr:competence/damage-inducible protein A [Echinicola vietnamensis]AGA78694.1 competence/damage-inducible protein CinA-like protein [Echinicola vietnamensis DSM 17526]
MKQITAEIIAIGDELLYGQIMDTNSHWISKELDQIGVRVVRKTTVGDNEPDILHAFRHAQNRANIILITGGLGPTKDDLTKPLLAKYFECSIEPFPEAIADVKAFFEKRGRELTPLNKLQGHLPTKCQYVKNDRGTAPGMWFEENGCVWMSMPGVPHEMQFLMENFVLPKIKTLFSLPVIYHKVIKTAGIGESWLADMIAEWEDQLPSHIKLAYLPSLGEVKLRLTAFGDDINQLQEEVNQYIQQVKPLIKNYIYGYDQETIAEAIGRILTLNKKTISIAESCTGGYVSHLVTAIPGSSNYFNGAITPYHNQFKTALLGVKESTLMAHGAVSEETVMEMASMVRKKFDADYGLATSGIAGPGGGSPEKPVGTVWIAIANREGVKTKKLQLAHDRLLNIQYSALTVLNLLRKVIKNEND